MTIWKKLFPDPKTGGAVPAAEQTPPAQPRGGESLPFHPFLFALFPLLALYAHNIAQIPLVQLWRPLGFALLAALGVWAIFLLVTRHLRKSAVAASVVVLVLFSYGHIVNLMPPNLRGLVIPCCVVVVAALLFVILRTRASLVDATRVLNLAGLVLVAPSVWTIGGMLWSASRTAPHPTEPGPKQMQPVARQRNGSPPMAAAARKLPDVYYLILDAYGRSDRLRQFYGFDNEPFLQALEKRGFYVARRSGANYNQTQLCLASALNMTYLDDSSQPLSPEALRQKIDENAVVTYLRKLGYQYVDVWSGLEESRVATADLVLNNEPDLSSFEGQALGLTPMAAAKQAMHSRYEHHRARIQGGFRNLEEAARLPSPKFVFTHILAPHPPFVFGPNGEAVDPRGDLTLADGSWLVGQISREQYIAGYTGQLQYVNRQVLEAVDTILKQSRRPPIVIIQGDHGSRMNLNWESQDRTDLREPFSILNAYYVPERVRRDLYATITPVNSFRIVLSDVFGAKLKRLPDRSFYSTAEHSYDFSEVTSLVSGAGSAHYTGPASAPSFAERPTPSAQSPPLSGGLR